MGAEEITRPIREGSLHVPPAAFHGEDSNWELSYDTPTLVNCSTGPTCRGVAPVDLPDGATVTRLVTYWYEHASDDDATAYLTREDPSGSYPPDNMAAVTTTGVSASRQILSDDSIDNATVFHSDRAYSLRVSIPSSSCYFYGAKIEYTYTSVGP